MTKLTITSKQEYKAAADRLEEIKDAKPNSLEAEELKQLVYAIKAYQKGLIRSK